MISHKFTQRTAYFSRYAEKAAADPMFLGRAYATTQPIPQFDENEVAEEDDDVFRKVSNTHQPGTVGGSAADAE